MNEVIPLLKKKKKTKSGSHRKATKTASKKAASPSTALLGMVKDLGNRFEELKKRTSEGAERAAEIAREIRKTVIEPRWRAFQAARKKR